MIPDHPADGQTFDGVRCEVCGVVRMRGMESRDGVVRCQDRHICEQVEALIRGARSTYADLIEAGWKPTIPDHPAEDADASRDALIAALAEEPKVMTLTHDRLILQRAEAGSDGRVVVVRCPHTIGLTFEYDDHLALLPCPCNDRSEVVARMSPAEDAREARPAHPPTKGTPCASCGEPATTWTYPGTRWEPVCLRHYNVWESPEYRAAREARLSEVERRLRRDLSLYVTGSPGIRTMVVVYLDQLAPVVADMLTQREREALRQPITWGDVDRALGGTADGQCTAHDLRSVEFSPIADHFGDVTTVAPLAEGTAIYLNGKVVGHLGPSRQEADGETWTAPIVPTADGQCT